MSCGTGSQVFFLKQKNYQITGVDLSMQLITMAKKRAKKQSIPVDFIHGDMRNVKAGSFDAVITIFNAIGHLSKAGFARALKNIRSNLNDNGIYIFDIFNLDAMSEKTVADLAYYVHKKIEDTQILSMQCSTVDRRKGLLHSYDTYLIQQSDKAPKQLKHKFSLQIYTKKELDQLLAQHGFKAIGYYAMDGKNLKKNSLTILTVAQKIGL